MESKVIYNMFNTLFPILYVWCTPLLANIGFCNKNKTRKRRYMSRHKKRENWNNYMSAGSLSRYILWNKPTLEASIKDYKKRFKLD